VRDIQFELPSLKAHQHTAKLVPVDLATIDNEKRDAAVVGIIPLNPRTHDSMVCDLQSVLAVRKMFNRQGAAHLFDQSPEQRQQIFLRIPDDLEVVASRMSVAKLEGVERDSGPEQTGAKVKFVEFSRTVSETHRFELSVFEAFQPV